MKSTFSPKQSLFQFARNWSNKNTHGHPAPTQVSTNDLSTYRLQNKTSVSHAEINEDFFAEMRKRDAHRVALAEAIYLSLLRGEKEVFSLAEYKKQKTFESEEDAKRFNAIVGITIRYLLNKGFIAYATDAHDETLPMMYVRGIDFSEWSSYFGSNQKGATIPNEV